MTDPVSQFFGTIFVLFFALAPLSIGPWIASNKNRSVGKAFLLCLLLGWFGVIGILFLEKKKKCPSCAARIPVEAFVCSYCGHDIRKK